MIVGAGSLAASIDLLGTAVHVEVADPAAAMYVSDLIGSLPRAGRPSDRTIRLVPHDGAARGRSLYDGDVLVQRDMSGPTAIRTLLWYLNQVALETSEYAVLHAGAVAEHGRAVILPARTDAGKSTLVAALVGAGFEYLSDEFAPVNLHDGTLLPYPSPLGLDAGSFPLFPHLKPEPPVEFDEVIHWHVPVEREPDTDFAPLVPVAIVFPSYREAAVCSMRRIRPTEALQLAANETLNLFDLGRDAFHALSALIRAAPAYWLTFSALDEACEAIRGLLGGGESS